MAKVTLKDGYQYWVNGQDFTVDQPVELDNSKDAALIDYISTLPNFEVELDGEVRYAEPDPEPENAPVFNPYTAKHDELDKFAADVNEQTGEPIPGFKKSLGLKEKQELINDFLAEHGEE